MPGAVKTFAGPLAAISAESWHATSLKMDKIHHANGPWQQWDAAGAEDEALVNPDLPLDSLSATTVIVRNLPSRCTQDQLTKLWPCNGTYDWLVLPYNSKQHRFSRYAFINFTSKAALQDFVQKWQGALLPEALYGWKTALPLEIKVARVQGLLLNFVHHMARIDGKPCPRPVIFRGNEQVNFDHMAEELLRLCGQDCRDGWTSSCQLAALRSITAHEAALSDVRVSRLKPGFAIQL